jgi:hypothetical protein
MAAEIVNRRGSNRFQKFLRTLQVVSTRLTPPLRRLKRLNTLEIENRLK